MRNTTTFSVIIGACMLFSSGAFAQGTLPTSPTTTTITAAASIGQTITIDGVAYKVSAKKVLAPGVEYYTLKGTVGKAATKYFVRSKSVYSPTVFNQAEYEAFFSTRKLSSFGALKSLVVTGHTLTYVMKGTTSAVLSAKGNDCLIMEVEGDLATIMARKNDNENPQTRAECLEGCEFDDDLCTDEHGDDDIDCINLWVGCVLRCNGEIPRTKVPHRITFSKPILKV